MQLVLSFFYWQPSRGQSGWSREFGPNANCWNWNRSISDGWLTHVQVWLTSPASHLSLPALPMHFFLPGWQQPFSTLTCLSSWKIKLSYVQRLHLLLLSADSGGVQNPEPRPFCLPAGAAAFPLLSCCTKCSQGRALWILQQPLLTINRC